MFKPVDLAGSLNPTLDTLVYLTNRIPANTPMYSHKPFIIRWNQLSLSEVSNMF